MKQFRKRMLASGLAVTVMMGTTTPTIKVFANEQTNFNDVSENHWAKSQIDAFIKEGVIAGYPDGSFKPSNKITRAEFVKIINKAFGFTSAGEITFTDVKEDAWYKTDVAIAVKAGYIDGFGDDTFRPNEEITREQMAKILGTILNVTGDGQTNFTDDSSIAPWAKKYVDGLVDKGVIQGYPDGTFKPKGSTTRAEGVKLTSDGKTYNSSQNNSNNNSNGSTQTPEEQKPSKPSTEQGTGTGAGGLLPNFGGSTGGSSQQGTTSTFTESATVNAVNAELNKPGVKTVQVRSGANLNGLVVPAGKTLRFISNPENTNTNIDNITIDGTVEIEEGITLNVVTSERNTTSNKANIKLNKNGKIIGKGIINLGAKSIELFNVNQIQVDIDNVSSASKIQNILGTQLNVIEGSIKVNISTGVANIKSASKGAKIEVLDKNIKLQLAEGQVLETGTYTYENGIWTKSVETTYTIDGKLNTGATIDEIKAELESTYSTIEVLGNITIDSSIQIPSGKTLKVDKNITLTVNAKVTGEGKIEGTDETSKLVIGTNGSYSTLESGKTYKWSNSWQEDKESQETSKTITSESELKYEGAIVELIAGNDLELSGNKEIPSEKTLNMDNKTLTLGKDVVLTVNGTLSNVGDLIGTTGATIKISTGATITGNISSLDGLTAGKQENAVEYKYDGTKWLKTIVIEIPQDGDVTSAIQEAFKETNTVVIPKTDSNSEVTIEQIELQEGQTLIVEADLNVTGTITVAEGAIMEATGTVILAQNAKMVVPGTISLAENSTIDLSQGGTINADGGTVDLSKGGTITDISNDTSFFKSLLSKLTKNNSKITLIEGGTVSLGKGKVYIKDLGTIKATITNVTNESTLTIGDSDNNIIKPNGSGVILVHDNSHLTFNFGENLGNNITHIMTVDGQVTFRDAYRFVITKATEDAIVNLQSKSSNGISEMAILYDGENKTKVAKNGETYIGKADGTWELKQDNTSTISVDLLPVTTSATISIENATITTPSTITVTTGQTTTSTTVTSNITTDATQINDNTQLELNIQLATDKKLEDVILANGNTVVKISLDGKEIKAGELITIVLTKDELTNAGLIIATSNSTNNIKVEVVEK